MRVVLLRGYRKSNRRYKWGEAPFTSTSLVFLTESTKEEIQCVQGTVTCSIPASGVYREFLVPLDDNQVSDAYITAKLLVGKEVTMSSEELAKHILGDTGFVDTKLKSVFKASGLMEVK
jgi:hypothetical protein